MEEARARELLAAERARIEAELRQLQAEVRPLDQDEAGDAGDVATETYEAEVDLGEIEDLQVRLAAVERAEARLAAGAYGLSVESGAPIPDARLELFPTAERTVEEERRYERGGLA
jgi:DnaK suppressor protein